VIAIAVAVVLAALLILRDVSARRRERVLMTEIASLRKQVTHTDRIANVGRLVSGLAQDLKSPLQGMLGSAEVLAVSDPASGPGAQEVQDIRDNVKRAVGIVRNLLAFTETSALNRRWHDLNDLVRRALDHKRQDGGDAERIKLEETPRLPLVYVDGRQIEKVIVTILDHATSHARSRAVGEVAIVTRRGTPADERLTVELDDPTLALPDDAPEWAGELHACRRVLEAHGGSFEIERRRAGGIRFRLELPVTEQLETQPQ
jgi:K+-sensing histidine kinase KdpD